MAEESRQGLPTLAYAEWIGAELPSTSLKSAKKMRLPMTKRYQAVKITRGDKVIVCGLGDIVHLESGREDNVPYVARIAALFEDPDPEHAFKNMQAQWLYGPSDLAKAPTDVKKNEMFLTAHLDTNRVEVILGSVRCRLLDNSGRSVLNSLFADAPNNENPEQEPDYQVSRVYDHVTHGIANLSELQVEALRRYDDESSLVALDIHVPKIKKNKSPQSEPESILRKPSASFSEGLINKPEDTARSESTAAQVLSEPHPQARKEISSESLMSLRDKEPFSAVHPEGTTTSAANTTSAKYDPTKTRGTISMVSGNSGEKSNNVDWTSTAETNAEGTENPLMKGSSVVDLNATFEHASTCKDIPCYCTEIKSLIQHGSQYCPVTNCRLCAAFTERIDYHSRHCKARLDSCPIPRCENHKPSVALHHAIKCSKLVCEQATCKELLSGLKHAQRCTQNQGNCSICQKIHNILSLHDSGCCANGMCRYPNCTHFAGILAHGLKKCQVKNCLECFVCTQLAAKHALNCHAQVGKCKFPLCPGTQPPPEVASIPETIDEINLDPDQTHSISSPRTMRMTARSHSAPASSPEGRSEETHQVPIGRKYQVRIPAWSPPAESLPLNDEPHVQLWSASNGIQDSEIDERYNLVTAAKDFYCGKLVIIKIHDNQGARQYMLSRVIKVDPETKWLTVIPFDVVWPKISTDPASFDVPSPKFLCRFSMDNLVWPENVVEAACYELQYESLAVKTNASGKRLRRLLDNKSGSWRESILESVERWSEQEFGLFCDAIRQHRHSAVNDLSKAIGTKSPAEVAKFCFFQASGVAKAPPCFYLCSKCHNADGVHVCKRFFSCGIALCTACFKARRTTKPEYEDIEGITWFCSICFLQPSQKPEIMSGASMDTMTDKVRLVEPNDGYDSTIAWSSRLSGSNSRTIMDAIGVLDMVAKSFSREFYDSVVDELKDIGTSTNAQLETAQKLQRLSAESFSEAPSWPMLLDPFLPHSMRL